MEKCQQLYSRLQQDLKPLVILDQDFSSDESMAMFALFILMKKQVIKDRDEDLVFTEQFEEIGNHYDTFDDKTKKTIWLYFDLFVKLCEKYTKEQTDNLVLDANTETNNMSTHDVADVLENKLGIKMNAGMEEMIHIIGEEVQKEIKKGNSNMKKIIKSVMDKVMNQFKSKIESGDINVDELKQSAEKLMSQIGNPASLFGMGGKGDKSREEKRKERRDRLRKKLAAKQSL